MEGDQQKMRKALEKVRFYLPYLMQYMRLKRGDAEAGGYYKRILEVVNAALAVPARNCDVGTADEQVERFHHQCFEWHTGRCSPHCRTLPAKTRQECALKWAQMPYEGKGESNE